MEQPYRAVIGPSGCRVRQGGHARQEGLQPGQVHGSQAPGGLGSRHREASVVAGQCPRADDLPAGGLPRAVGRSCTRRTALLAAQLRAERTRRCPVTDAFTRSVRCLGGVSGVGVRISLKRPSGPWAACREGREAVPLHVGTPVMAGAAVALIDSALRHDLARMPRCPFLAHVPCVRRPAAGRDSGSPRHAVTGAESHPGKMSAPTVVHHFSPTGFGGSPSAGRSPNSPTTITTLLAVVVAGHLGTMQMYPAPDGGQARPLLAQRVALVAEIQLLRTRSADRRTRCDATAPQVQEAPTGTKIYTSAAIIDGCTGSRQASRSYSWPDTTSPDAYGCSGRSPR
ncbi:hypothetical protein JOC24_002725 [Streptomyces sp. HB132]|nr:hypothetical protein [Streptomyces sp. HB132]